MGSYEAVMYLKKPSVGGYHEKALAEDG